MGSQVSTAASLGGYHEVNQGLAENIPYEENSFQTVISVCVLEHVEDLKKTFENITRVLRAGGHLLITVISEKHNKGLLLPTLFRNMRLINLAEKYTFWFNKRNFHHRPDFSLDGYKEILSNQYDFISIEHFWSIKNRRFYDILGLSPILFSYDYGNLPVALSIINEPATRFLGYKVREWLLVPRLLNNAADSRENHTHLFLLLKKKVLPDV